MLRVLVSLVLLVGITPGAGELLETVIGAAHADGAGGDESRREHGCTPVTHTCGCHAAAPAAMAIAVDGAVVAPTSRGLDPPRPSMSAGRLAGVPALRPPIA